MPAAGRRERGDAGIVCSGKLPVRYDANGNAVAVNYNGTYYYYVRNGQNDVIRLIDGSNPGSHR